MLSRNAKLIILIIVILYIFANPANAGALVVQAGHSLAVFAHSIGLG